jgi:hypothetical protein
VFVTVISTIGGLQLFTEPQVLFNGLDGPLQSWTFPVVGEVEHPVEPEVHRAHVQGRELRLELRGRAHPLQRRFGDLRR